MDRPGTRTEPSSSLRRLVPLAVALALGASACSTLAAEPGADRSTPDLAASGLGPAPTAIGRDGPMTDPTIGAGADRATMTDRMATDAAGLRDLGQRLIQQARETGDPSVLARAEEAFSQVLALAPDDPEAAIGLGSIALSRHEFGDALELGLEAEALAPDAARPLGIQFDALVELGRYEEAGAVLERMLLARPDLASYARLSYFHELHGRLDAAIDAMERAVVAGGAAVENTEYARVLLGDLWLLAGDPERATFLYEAALTAMPGSVPALRGLARVAVGRGDLDGAAGYLETAVARTPFPDLLTALGEAQEAAGRHADAEASYQLVGEIEDLYRSAGVAAEPAQAVFEADHGDRSVAVELAEASYRATPSIRAADALGWALHRAGRSEQGLAYAREAVRIGTLEPSFHYHLGVIAAALGADEEAIGALRQSLSSGTGWSAIHGPRAAELLESLS